MLKKRIITALILIPLVIWVIFQPNLYIFYSFIAFLGLGLLWEYCSLVPIKNLFLRMVYIFVIIFFSYFMFLLPSKMFLQIALLHWIFALGFLLRFAVEKNSLNISRVLKLFWGVWVVLGLVFALVFLRRLDHGSLTITFLMLLVWSSDIGAYFVGKRFGKHKLCKNISPGKTWEGFFGGLLGTLIIALSFITFFPPQTHLLLGVIVLATLVHVFGVLGDLFESMLKRLVNVKDSGKLLPGHGGIYDRIDSLTTAAPIFSLSLIWLAWVG